MIVNVIIYLQFSKKTIPINIGGGGNPSGNRPPAQPQRQQYGRDRGGGGGFSGDRGGRGGGGRGVGERPHNFDSRGDGKFGGQKTAETAFKPQTIKVKKFSTFFYKLSGSKLKILISI